MPYAISQRSSIVAGVAGFVPCVIRLFVILMQDFFFFFFEGILLAGIAMIQEMKQSEVRQTFNKLIREETLFILFIGDPSSHVTGFP